MSRNKLNQRVVWVILREKMEIQLPKILTKLNYSTFFLASVFTSENDSEIPKCDQLIDDITLVTESILKQLSELNASKAIV